MKLDNKNIFGSISAGYSSVMMAILLRKWYPDHNIIYGMANTSKERKESLRFMNECNDYYNLNMVWIRQIFMKKEKEQRLKLQVTRILNAMEKYLRTELKNTEYQIWKINGAIEI